MKNIKLIELFSGYGSQFMSLKRLTEKIETHKISEWDINANRSYYAVHNNEDKTNYAENLSKEEIIEYLLSIGVSFDGKSPATEAQLKRKKEDYLRNTYNEFKANDNLGSICNFKGQDLNIVNTNDYTYIMTYSYPCTSLSLAGKCEGMEKGSGTASALLWEVERLLTELKELNTLPQVLLMKNVTQVYSKSINKNTGRSNYEAFKEWIEFLESIGYVNFYEGLNSKDYNVAQSRNRCYMVSFLKSEFGENINYEFPEKKPLTKCLRDYLEEDVPLEYYVLTDRAYDLIKELVKNDRLNLDNTNEIKTLGNYTPSGHESSRVLDSNGIAPTIKENHGTVNAILDIKYKNDNNYITLIDKVKVRKFQVDKAKLQNVLRKAKKELKITNQDIANKLELPLTMVSHWFRTDNSFAIPEDTIWYKLKEILNISTNEFDEAIMTFEERESIYEKSQRVYLSGGISPTITTMAENEKVIVAMRGRNPENPLSRIAGLPTEQRLEVNTNGISNTITTAVKDNMVLEKTKIQRVGQISSEGSQCGTVISQDGLMSTLGAGCHGYANPHILVYDDYNHQIKVDQSSIGALTGNYGNQALGNASKLIEINEKAFKFDPKWIFEIDSINYYINIRKLTERECGRLMGVSDEDITKMKEVQSKSALYKQFGNSIVVDVLYEIFKNVLAKLK